MLVQFLRDFRGAATGEVFYEAGQQVDLPDDQAFACFAEDAAALVEEEEDDPTPVKRGRKARNA